MQGRPISEPFNLAPGWVKFDFRKAFGKPVKVINDAAMQALGSYKKGRMLFLGLGTGLGSAMIVDGVLQPMELAHLPFKKGRTYEDYLGRLEGELREAEKQAMTHGHLPTAVAWVRARGLSCDDELDYLTEFEHIALAKVTLARLRAQRSAEVAGNAATSRVRCTHLRYRVA